MVWVLEQNHEVVPPGPIFEKTMKTILYSKMPASWRGFINEVKCKKYESWLEVEERLIEFEEQEIADKQEPAGRAYMMKEKAPKQSQQRQRGVKRDREPLTADEIREMTPSDLEQYVTKRVNRATNDHMNKWKQKMHTQQVCLVKGRSKGKSKGYQNRDKSQDVCRRCNRRGHWANECWTKLEPVEDRSNKGKGKGFGNNAGKGNVGG